jgi:HlyD family secretion protein
MNQIFHRATFWLALAGLVSLALFIRANTAVQPMPEPVFAPPVKPFANSIGASGIIEAMRENTSVATPIAATVSTVAVQVSQNVLKGDILFTLDDREPRAKLISLQAELVVREAESNHARRQFERIAKIGSGAAVAREEVETREDNLAVAVTQVEKSKAAIAETHLMLERFVVRAPIEGTILQVNLRAGEYATPGSSTPPIILGSTDELQIRVDVDEQIASRVQAEARAVAYRKGDTQDAIPLQFVRIEPFVVPKKSLTGSSSERVDTRVLQVIFRFKNSADLKTYVGQQVDVFIEETTR